MAAVTWSRTWPLPRVTASAGINRDSVVCSSFMGQYWESVPLTVKCVCVCVSSGSWRHLHCDPDEGTFDLWGMGGKLLLSWALYGVQCQDPGWIDWAPERSTEEDHRQDEQQWLQGTHTHTRHATLSPTRIWNPKPSFWEVCVCVCVHLPGMHV